MKEFKGTTGEWKAVHYSPWSNKVTTVDGYEIADVYDGRCNGVFSITEAEANAQLIAAAPELLNALQALMDGVANLPPLTAIEGVLEKQYKQAEKAINKALGL